jgi:DNA-binding NtrC family response regulator
VATHQDLVERQAAKDFRKDLFYRLRTHHVHIPALRERRKDIPVLLDHFLDEAARTLGKKKPTYPSELPVLLMNYAFPGNVRELKGMVYDAVSVHKSRMLSMSPFKRAIDEQGGMFAFHTATELPTVFVPNRPLPALREVIDLLVLEAMRRAEFNQSIAARLLGISQPALCKRLKKMAE